MSELKNCDGCILAYSAKSLVYFETIMMELCSDCIDLLEDEIQKKVKE